MHMGHSTVKLLTIFYAMHKLCKLWSGNNARDKKPTGFQESTVKEGINVGF